MATFPISSRVYNTRFNTRPKIKVLSFGDGFEQRLTEGLNQNPLTGSLTFERSQSDADTAITFLDSRVTDGASGALFIAELKKNLENPVNLII